MTRSNNPATLRLCDLASLPKIKIQVLEFNITVERPNRPMQTYPPTRRNIQRIADYVTRKQHEGQATVRPWCGQTLGYVAEITISPTRDIPKAEAAYWQARQEALATAMPFQPDVHRLPYLGFIAAPVKELEPVSADELLTVIADLRRKVEAL